MNEDWEKIEPRLSELMKNGVDRFDPPRFCYIQSLARRAARMQPTVCRILEEKARRALDDYLRRYDQARAEALRQIPRMTLDYPEIAEQIRILFNKGDLKGVKLIGEKHRLEQRESPLAELLKCLLQDNPAFGKNSAPPSLDDLLRQEEKEILNAIEGAMASPAPSDNGKKMELKTFDLFKETWAQFHSDELVTRAIRQRPENAGPLNSQMLVTRSLFVMRNLSPNYLKRFVQFIHTLLWLEQAGDEIKSRSPKKGNRNR